MIVTKKNFRLYKAFCFMIFQIKSIPTDFLETFEIRQIIEIWDKNTRYKW